MTNCAVPGCKENGSHLFPKDKKLKKLWAEAIKRPKLAKSQSLYLKICGHHFKESDYRTVKLSTGFNLQRRKLKENAVPSVFPWSKLKLNPQEFSDSSDDDTEIPETEFLDINKQQSSSYSDIEIQDINKSTQTSVPLRLISTEELLSDDTSVFFFTGLETHKKFKFVFSTLCPMAYNLCYKSCNVISLSVEDQFLLTLMKLKRNYYDFELSKIFGVSKSIVSNIFVTWLNFMYDTWSLINLWPTQEVVRYYTPESFKKYKNTRIIVDSIEVPICKPKNPLSQQATFSKYKNKNTMKFLIGATPGGLISYCSEGYGGATSDRRLIERSQLTTLCQAGDTIMADERFNIQEIFAPKDRDKIPKSKLKGMSQLSTHDLKKDRELSKQRVHIERLIGLTKTYTILKTEVNRYYMPLTSKIFFVCVMLCNFRESVKLSLNKYS